MSTVSFTPETIERQWHVVDLEGKILGRACSRIASILRGKHKPTYTPHADCGDFVVIVNAEKVVLTGRKLDQKEYFWHTGYFGGIKSRTAAEMQADKPERMIELAVRGVLAKGPLGRSMLKKLKVYAGADHPHQAQNPQPIELDK